MTSPIGIHDGREFDAVMHDGREVVAVMHDGREVDWGTPTPSAGLFAAGVDGRHLVDQHGAPWFGVGDSAWSLVAQLSPVEITQYLEDRSDRGFNLVLFSAPEALYSNQTPKYLNYSGASPFVGALFASPLNEPYWTVVDHAISECERLGITALFCPMYIGWAATDGWRDEIAAVTDQNIADYGNSLLDRYADRPNLMWLVGHDGQPVATDLERWGVLYGIIRSRSSHLITAAGYGIADLGSSFWPGFTVDLDAIYNYSNNIGQLHYSNQPAATPIGFLEGHYEDDIDQVPGDSPILRSQAYGALTGGGTYAWFGNNPIWNFDAADVAFPHTTVDWVDALAAPGSQMMERFGSFVSSIGAAWADMAPDLASAFVTVGAGSGISLVSAIYDASATAGVLAVAYRPDDNGNDLSFDLTQLAAPAVDVVAVDPTDLTGTVLGASVSSTFAVTDSTLGTNSLGDSDWLVVFRSST